MKIVDLIRRETIVPALSSVTKPEILRELAKCIGQATPTVDEDTLWRVLSEREQLGSTAIGDGVAIPHGKLRQVHDVVACLGRAPAGVEFDSVDGQPTYLFFVLIAPESSTTAHLKAVARISRVFKDEAFRQRLRMAPDAAAMYQVIAEEDAKH